MVWTPDVVAAWEAFGIRPAVAVWTPTQLAEFLTRIRHHRLYAAFHLAALRGLRQGEVVGLRWCDVDLDNGVLHVAWQLQKREGDPGCSRGTRRGRSARTTRPFAAPSSRG